MYNCTNDESINKVCNGFGGYCENIATDKYYYSGYDVNRMLRYLYTQTKNCTQLNT